MRNVEISTGEQNIRPLASGVTQINLGRSKAISDISDWDLWNAQHTLSCHRHKKFASKALSLIMCDIGSDVDETHRHSPKRFVRMWLQVRKPLRMRFDKLLKLHKGKLLIQAFRFPLRVRPAWAVIIPT